MWFLNRDMYGTQTNTLVYKKKFNDEINTGYQLAKNKFDSDSFFNFNHNNISAKIIKEKH